MVLLVIGLYVYFVLIPAALNPELYNTYVPTVHLYVVLDVYITGRLFSLFLAAGSRRWQSIYALLTLTYLISVVNDFRGWALFEELEGVQGVPALWNLMIVAFVVAVRLRHHPFREAPQKAAPTEPARAEPRWQTLFFALIFPLIHFAADAAGVLDPASGHARKVLVAVWLLLIGGVALLQCS